MGSLALLMRSYVVPGLSCCVRHIADKSLAGWQAVAIDDTAPNKSWALVTFKSESAVEKATQQPVQVGTETLKVESASFSKVVEMNRITVAHDRNWKTEVAGALPWITARAFPLLTALSTPILGIGTQTTATVRPHSESC